jgi:hypothetical protein
MFVATQSQAAAGVNPYAAQTFLNAAKAGLDPGLYIELCRGIAPLLQIAAVTNLFYKVTN